MDYTIGREFHPAPKTVFRFVGQYSTGARPCQPWRIRAHIRQNCKIVVKDKERVLLEIKKRVVVPGEMERVTLTQEKIKSSIGEIEVYLEEGV